MNKNAFYLGYISKEAQGVTPQAPLDDEAMSKDLQALFDSPGQGQLSPSQSNVVSRQMAAGPRYTMAAHPEKRKALGDFFTGIAQGKNPTKAGLSYATSGGLSTISPWYREDLANVADAYAQNYEHEKTPILSDLNAWGWDKARKILPQGWAGGLSAGEKAEAARRLSSKMKTYNPIATGATAAVAIPLVVALLSKVLGGRGQAAPQQPQAPPSYRRQLYGG